MQSIDGTPVCRTNEKPAPLHRRGSAKIRIADNGVTTLFQDGETEHETIVREAVEKFKPVPLAVLEEYRDREWAQAEIKRRKVWKKYEWLEGLAIGYDSWEELRDYMNAKGNKNSANEIRSMEPYYSDRFYKELWARRGFKDSLSHGMTQEKLQRIILLPRVITDGKLINEGKKETFKGRVLASPVRIAGKDFIELVLLCQHGENDNKLYVHEVVLKEKAQGASKPIEAKTPDGHLGLSEILQQGIITVNDSEALLYPLLR